MSDGCSFELTKPADRFIVPPLGDFFLLTNLRRWFVADNDCQLHFWLRRFGVSVLAVQKFNPHQRLFKECLAQLQCLNSGLERPGLTPLGSGFGDFILLSWSFYVQLSGSDS